MIIEGNVYFKKGEVYFADLPIEEGSSAQGGYRPIVILSCDKNNDHSTLVHYATLTAQTEKSMYIPAHVLVNPNFLRKPSVVQCEQNDRIEQEKLIDYIDWKKSCIGTLSEEELYNVDLGLMAHYGIGVPTVKFFINKVKSKSYNNTKNNRCLYA